MLSLFGHVVLCIVSLLLYLDAQVILVLFIQATALLVLHSLGVVCGEHVSHQHVVIEGGLRFGLLDLRVVAT